MARCGLCVMLLALVCESFGQESLNQLYRSKRIPESVASDSSDCLSSSRPQVLTNSPNFSMDLRMPAVIPDDSDTYLCMAFPVPTRHTLYVVDFIPQASMKTVHHMLLFGCRSPVSTTDYWDCGSAQGTCEDKSSILYAWARNAPHKKLPKDVGFKVGPNAGVSYFVLQIHYGDATAFQDHHKDCSGVTLQMTSTPQPFTAGIYLLGSVGTVIQPGNTVTNADVACDYTSHPIHPFAFRTHTHRLGKVVSGYRVRNGEWTLIGRQSPQLPQAFYPANHDVDVQYGDTLAARCMFTGEGRTTETYIGGSSNDEMCNFYMMYYMDSKHAVPFMTCMKRGSAKLFQRIPAEANVPIAVSPENINSMMHMGHQSEHQDSTSSTDATNEEQTFDQDLHLEHDTTWPQNFLQLGQVSGLAVDSESNLVIFHRGDHRWGADSFDGQAIYRQRFLGPIQQSTILVVNGDNGNVLKASGRNMFYLPHGITIDKDNNYWVTDVALHQVLKVSSDGDDQVLLSLGEPFTPGSSHSHFCQPADVAVDQESGNIFVADGYCNARIVKFSTDGRYISQWGAGSSDRRRRIPFRIPHSLAFAPGRKELCVADRENARVQCFVAQTGEFVKEIKKEEFGDSLFAIAFSPAGDQDGVLFAVNGKSRSETLAPPIGFVIDDATKDVLDTFSPKNTEFEMPHDIAVTQNGSVFVGDATSNRVFKFTAEKAHRSVKKAGIEVQELQEIETFIQTKVTPEGNTSRTTEVERKPFLAQHLKPPEEEKEKILVKTQGFQPVIITVLLLIPLALVVAIGVFVCWRKNNQSEVKPESSSVGGILGKIRGKTVGSLNLGNFFASHKGYSRQGFDQLSTEGSDQERNEEETSESENEEYSARPPGSS
ncbi:peptidyl-glycine alpha-amidating monooxygenase B isoform X2 [Stigmatopora nigra]